MKKYMKNKNFIPEKFYHEVELRNSKNNNKIIILFLVINLMLLPITYKEINKVNEKTPAINNIKSDKIYLGDVIKWINNIFNDSIERANIANGNGEIIVNNIDKINELTLNDSLKINEISKNEDEKYKLGVSLNE